DLGRAVPDDELVPGLAQVGRHPAAHDPEPDPPDAHAPTLVAGRSQSRGAVFRSPSCGGGGPKPPPPGVSNRRRSPGASVPDAFGSTSVPLTSVRPTRPADPPAAPCGA